MKKLFLLLIFFSFSMFSQEKRIEEVYQDCAYGTLEDKGTSLRHYMKGYENYLIHIQVLKDSTAKSYYEVFKSMSNGKVYNTDSFIYSFIDSINLEPQNGRKIFPSSHRCMREIQNHKDYHQYKSRLEKIFSSEDQEIKEVLKKYINILNEEDFKLDFYKLQTLNFIDLVSFVSSELTEEIFPEVEEEMIIYVDADMKITYGKIVFKLEELEKVVKKYLVKNELPKLIRVKPDRKLMYRKYLNIIKEIEKAISAYRNKWSKKRFQLLFSELDTKKKKEIESQFPVYLDQGLFE